MRARRSARSQKTVEPSAFLTTIMLGCWAAGAAAESETESAAGAASPVRASLRAAR